MRDHSLLQRLASLALSACLAACTPPPTQDPAVVVEAFYASLLYQPILGAPDSAELARIAPYLGDTLKARLAVARRTFERATAATPGDKPPFADEDLFTSLLEGPTSFYLTPTLRDKVVRVPVRLERNDGTASTKWADTVYLVPLDTTWVITDIAFGGTWPMAAKGTLQQRLQQ